MKNIFNEQSEASLTLTVHELIFCENYPGRSDKMKIYTLQNVGDIRKNHKGSELKGNLITMICINI